MKNSKNYFIQFYHLSTGYVQGTIPPVFKKSARVPIPACGSDSIYFCDGRHSMRSRVRIAREICKDRKFVGFTIEQGDLLNSSIVRKLEVNNRIDNL